MIVGIAIMITTIIIRIINMNITIKVATAIAKTCILETFPIQLLPGAHHPGMNNDAMMMTINYDFKCGSQFWEDWSADEVWPGVWIGNKGAALKVHKIIVPMIVIILLIVLITKIRIHLYRLVMREVLR